MPHAHKHGDGCSRYDEMAPVSLVEFLAVLLVEECEPPLFDQSTPWEIVELMVNKCLENLVESKILVWQNSRGSTDGIEEGYIELGVQGRDESSRRLRLEENGEAEAGDDSGQQP